MNPIDTIEKLFESRGRENYGTEAVTQLQHALQSAMLAEAAQAPDTLIAAALLHDLGHIMTKAELPEGLAENLDDKHEERAFPWLNRHFGAAVADPVRLHVPAKRYLCTIDPGYQETLSPTSLKSFFDQGGMMSEEEKASFEAEPHFEAAVQLRRWDDLAKDPEKEMKEVADYKGMLESLLIRRV